MKKIIKNTVLLACMVGVVVLIGVVLSNDSPIPVEIPYLDEQTIAANQAAAKEAQQAARQQARRNRVYTCKADEDCIIVDKDPCGCSVGPKGVVSVNINFLPDFEQLNRSNMGTKTCPEELSTVRECSPTARAVCRASRCSIAY